MNNLMEKYNYFNLNYNDYYLLGLSTPNIHLKTNTTQEIIKNFLYTYSFLGLNALDIHSLDTLKIILENKLNSLKYLNRLNFEQKWWALVLIYLHIGAEYHKFDFFISTCETILDSIQTISERDLIFYCNSLNDSLSLLIGYELRIRPHMDKKTNIELLPLYSKLTMNHLEISTIFKNFFSKKEILSKDIIREVNLIKDIDIEYNHWDIVFDIFVGQLISQINLDMPFECLSEKDTLRNSIELSILNISEDSDFMPKDLSKVSDLISDLISNH